MVKTRKVTRYRDSLRTERRKHLRNRVLFVVGILAAVVGGLVYVLFFAHLFDVRNITVKSDNVHSELLESIQADANQWLDGKKLFLQRRRNVLFVSTSQLGGILAVDFPKIDSIGVTRHLTHGIEISIKERSPLGIWCMTVSDQPASPTGRCYYFNKAGIIYEESPATSGFLVLSVEDQRNREVKLGDKIADDVWLQAITDTYKKLNDKKIRIKTMIIPDSSIDEFYALTSANLRILFSIQTDIGSQIEAMVNFIAQKLSPDRIATLQYIDLRIQDRIYYK